MKYSRKKATGMEMSLEDQEEHRQNEEIAEALFEEAETLKKQREEYDDRVNEMLNSGVVKRSERKGLDRERRKLRKKYESVELKLEFLRMKNIKGIIKEVKKEDRKHG